MSNTPPERVRIVTNSADPHDWNLYDAATGEALRNVRSVVIRAGVDQPTTAELTLLHLNPPEFSDKGVKSTTVSVPADVDMDLVALTKEPAPCPTPTP